MEAQLNNPARIDAQVALSNSTAKLSTTTLRRAAKLMYLTRLLEHVECGFTEV